MGKKEKKQIFCWVTSSRFVHWIFFSIMLQLTASKSEHNELSQSLKRCCDEAIAWWILLKLINQFHTKIHKYSIRAYTHAKRINYKSTQLFLAPFIWWMESRLQHDETKHWPFQNKTCHWKSAFNFKHLRKWQFYPFEIRNDVAC